MDFFDLISERHSARSYTRQPISRDDLEAILAAARRAPSAGNLQSWSAVVVEGRRALTRVAQTAFHEDFIADAAVAIVFAADPVRAAGEYGKRGAELYCVQDATIACAYAQLAATARGLDSVWIGAFDERALAHAVGLDPDLRPVAILPVGHGALRARPTTRRPLDSLVRRVTS